VPDSKPQFVHFDDVRAFELAAGVSARPLFGASVMISLVEADPDSVVAAHSHANEQLGLVLRGLQVLVVNGVEHPLEPMDAYVVPPGVEHGARFGPEGATLLDVFHPVRHDYRQRWQEEDS
jgi:quercetin dioxygenase-like cupin family protein